jgi:molybdate transport system substrate-binding protein
MPYLLVGRIAAIALLVVAQTVLAASAELKILTTPALTEVWHGLAPTFEATGHKLTIVFAVSGAIAKRVAEGETADLLVSTPAGIDSLIKDGKVMAGTNTALASSGMGVAVLAGTTKPDISSPEALKRALLAA